MKYKKCCICKKTKAITEFYKNRCKKDGLQGYCEICSVISCTRHRLKNPEYYKVYRKKRWQKHKERLSAVAKKWYKKNPELVTKYNLKKDYGITPKDYDKMLAEQNGRCAICGNPETALNNQIRQDNAELGECVEVLVMPLANSLILS